MNFNSHVFPYKLQLRSSSWLICKKPFFSTSEAFFCFVFCSFAVCNELLCVAGGRFKKEIVVDGQSYLLLIRDEGGPPEAQVSSKPWFPCFYKLPLKELALLCSVLGLSHSPAGRIPASPKILCSKWLGFQLGWMDECA